MAIFNIQGIIFRSVDYGDSSKILTVFTQDRGFISVMARGVKGPKSKKQNLVAPFSEVMLELNRSKDFYYLKDGELVSDNLHLRDKLINIYLSQVFFDIIESTIIKEDTSDQEYRLLAKTLFFFKEQKSEGHPLRLANMFLIKYISMIGYKPILNHCSKCSKKDLSMYFSLDQGGLVCQDHKGYRNTLLSVKEITYLNQALYKVYEDIGTFGADVDEKSMFKLIIDFILYNTDIRPPKALAMAYKLIGIN